MSLLKGLFGNSSQTPSISPSQARVQRTEARLASMRKADFSSKDSAVRGTIQASSAREHVMRSLGKQNAPTRGSSIARLGPSGGSNPFTLPPRLPPMRPMGK
ncbi:hypothetical protein KJ781_00165 [Patescibacteria group bacterium]|nr:hypothetical protein [Patescibacteria group bacterium]MBU1448766.1 hypothetical protein [Patescibacteria group bacterium]MBU2613398.1 hypothetical protein [Patescibacteria group bacterium]